MSANTLPVASGGVYSVPYFIRRTKITACSRGIWVQGQYFGGLARHPAERPSSFMPSAHGSAQGPFVQSSLKICAGTGGTYPAPKLARRIKTAACPRFMIWSGQYLSGDVTQPAVNPLAYRISIS